MTREEALKEAREFLPPGQQHLVCALADLLQKTAAAAVVQYRFPPEPPPSRFQPGMTVGPGHGRPGTVTLRSKIRVCADGWEEWSTEVGPLNFHPDDLQRVIPPEPVQQTKPPEQPKGLTRENWGDVVARDLLIADFRKSAPPGVSSAHTPNGPPSLDGQFWDEITQAINCGDPCSDICHCLFDLRAYLLWLESKISDKF